MEVDFKLVGANISKMRRIKNITQRELCKNLGVSNGYISQIECGTSKVSISTLYDIADFLKCSIHDFLPSDTMSEEQKAKQICIHEIKTSSEQIKDYIEDVFQNNTRYADYCRISENTFSQITKQQQRAVCYALAAYIAVSENNKDK